MAQDPIQYSQFKDLAREIAQVGRFLAEQKWSPATSSNYSARLSEQHYALTRSGVDKYLITEDDIVIIDSRGGIVSPKDAKPSAETLIHCEIYARTNAGAVLHTHSVRGTRLSLKYAGEKQIVFEGYELLKGLAGNTTHKMTEVLPILPNSQSMDEFCSWLSPVFNTHPRMHGFLIAGHGLYTWGRDLSEAKRHVESFEFLFEALTLELTGV